MSNVSTNLVVNYFSSFSRPVTISADKMDIDSTVLIKSGIGKGLNFTLY